MTPKKRKREKALVGVEAARPASKDEETASQAPTEKKGVDSARQWKEKPIEAQLPLQDELLAAAVERGVAVAAGRRSGAAAFLGSGLAAFLGAEVSGVRLSATLSVK